VRPRITETLAALAMAERADAPAARPPATGAWIGKPGRARARGRHADEPALGRALEDGAITAEEIERLHLRADVSALQSTLAGIDKALEEITRAKLPGPLQRR
jgi:hypothetical protein